MGRRTARWEAVATGGQRQLTGINSKNYNKNGILTMIRFDFFKMPATTN